jgi:hypothetical protein
VLDKKVIKAAVNAILYLRLAGDENFSPTQSTEIPEVQTIGTGIPLFNIDTDGVKGALSGEQASVSLITDFSPENLIKEIVNLYNKNYDPKNPKEFNDIAEKALNEKYGSLLNIINPEVRQVAKSAS